MASLEEIRKERLKKLAALREGGIDPYPSATSRDHEIGAVLSDFENLAESGDALSVAGRIMAMRSHGGSTFIDIYDGTGKIQGFLTEEDLSPERFSAFSELSDIGDFIELSGAAYLTKRGEKSVKASSWKMLSKSLRPLPEKWHGLKDEEEILRKRYLDILMNDGPREILEKKALFFRTAREFLEARGFIEVQTPTLETTTGGAEATPFKTHINDFDLDVYLRISVGELWQKRLMAAGIPKTFEIGRVYRNEGSSPEHVQEFTNVEFYASYMNFEEGKELVRHFYQELAQKTFGKLQFETRGHKFDLSGQWPDFDYVETVKKMTGVDVVKDSEEKLEKKLEELGVEYRGKNRERMTDALWKHCRRSVSGPAFLVNHPRLVAPLSKTHPDDPDKTKTLQVIIAGSEMGRAHAELNDPADQAERFDIQQKLREAGDTEAQMADWDYVEAMEYGMPPIFGFGFGERLFAYLADKTIRETQTFPLVKPKED